MLASLFWFLLVCHGVTLIVTESKIAEPLRRGAGSISLTLGTLTRCPMCFGFWVGVLLSMVSSSPSMMIGLVGWQATVADGFASSAFCWSMHVWQFAAGSERIG